MSIQEIRVTHIKALLDAVMARGVHNTAEKIREWTAAVFDYAAMLEITEANPARILRQYIPPLLLLMLVFVRNTELSTPSANGKPYHRLLLPCI